MAEVVNVSKNKNDIEVIATKNGKHYIQHMTAAEWSNFKKKPRFSYIAYQKGFSQFKLENNK